MTHTTANFITFLKSTHEIRSTQGIENVAGRRSGRPWPENWLQLHKRKMRKDDMDLQIKWMIPFCN